MNEPLELMDSTFELTCEVFVLQKFLSSIVYNSEVFP